MSDHDIDGMIRRARLGYGYPKGASGIYRTWPYNMDRLEVRRRPRTLIGIHIKSKGRTGAAARLHLQRAFRP